MRSVENVDLDSRILRLLRQNPHAGIQIANKLGASPEKVRGRLQALKRAGEVETAMNSRTTWQIKGQG